MELSESQKKKMRHACGDKPQSEAHRNYYNSSTPDPDWEELVAADLAIKFDRGEDLGGLYYHLTNPGFEAIAPLLGK